MRRYQPAPSLDACPFIDEDDPACASHFTLSRLAQAFNECIGGYRACPTYWAKLRDNPRHAAPESLITITVHGRSLQPSSS